MTLQDMSQADLLTAAIIPPGDLHRTRRKLLQKAAMIGLALQVVESVVAQSAKAHASDRKGNWDHRDHRSCVIEMNVGIGGVITDPTRQE
jgi:hypothetical protein